MFSSQPFAGGDVADGECKEGAADNQQDRIEHLESPLPARERFHGRVHPPLMQINRLHVIGGWLP
jgi:hypothetical protein